jgi:hypothetical protein
LDGAADETSQLIPVKTEFERVRSVTTYPHFGFYVEGVIGDNGVDITSPGSVVCRWVSPTTTADLEYLCDNPDQVQYTITRYDGGATSTSIGVVAEEFSDRWVISLRLAAAPLSGAAFHKVQFYSYRTGSYVETIRLDFPDITMSGTYPVRIDVVIPKASLV